MYPVYRNIVVTNLISSQAVKYLEDYHLQDEAEENEQKKILLPLYQNLSLCNLKLSMCEGSAIMWANRALQIDRTAKALFLKGKVRWFLFSFALSL